MTNLGVSGGDWEHIYRCPKCNSPVAMEKRKDKLVGKCPDCDIKIEVFFENFKEWQGEIIDEEDNLASCDLSKYEEDSAYE